jgi:hypothetical protein
MSQQEFEDDLYVVVSYSTRNKRYANLACRALSELDVRTYFYEADHRPGNWKEQVFPEIRAATHFLAIASCSYAESKSCNDELTEFMAQEDAISRLLVVGVDKDFRDDVAAFENARALELHLVGRGDEEFNYVKRYLASSLASGERVAGGVVRRAFASLVEAEFNRIVERRDSPFDPKSRSQLYMFGMPYSGARRRAINPNISLFALAGHARAVADHVDNPRALRSKVLPLLSTVRFLVSCALATVGVSRFDERVFIDPIMAVPDIVPAGLGERWRAANRSCCGS